MLEKKNDLNFAIIPWWRGLALSEWSGHVTVIRLLRSWWTPKQNCSGDFVNQLQEISEDSALCLFISVSYRAGAHGLPTINIQFSLYCVPCGFAYSSVCELFVSIPSMWWLLDYECIYETWKTWKVGGGGQQWIWRIKQIELPCLLCLCETMSTLALDKVLKCLKKQAPLKQIHMYSILLEKSSSWHEFGHWQTSMWEVGGRPSVAFLHLLQISWNWHQGFCVGVSSISHFIQTYDL